jgi:hypothetical protein
MRKRKEKKRKEKETMEDPVDMREEFRKIQSENMVTMNRMVANISIDLITPLKSVEEGIERNLVENPTNTRIIIEEVETIKEEQRGIGAVQILQNEEEIRKLNTITSLETLNLVQTSEVKSDLKEMKTSMEEVKLVIKEMHQKIIEYGINQEEKKNE